MSTPTMTGEEHAAFWTGFDLAKPPGRAEINALGRAEEAAPAGPGQLRIAVSKDLAKEFLAVVEPLPEHLAGAAWAGFLRGMAAHADGAPAHVHQGGTA